MYQDIIRTDSFFISDLLSKVVIQCCRTNRCVTIVCPIPYRHSLKEQTLSLNYYVTIMKDNWCKMWLVHVQAQRNCTSVSDADGFLLCSYSSTKSHINNRSFSLIQCWRHNCFDLFHYKEFSVNQLPVLPMIDAVKSIISF